MASYQASGVNLFQEINNLLCCGISDLVQEQVSGVLEGLQPSIGDTLRKHSGVLRGSNNVQLSH